MATVHDFPGRGRPKKSATSARDRRRRLILGAVVVVLVVGVTLLHRVFGLYIDWLWFDEVGQLGVFWTTIWWRLAVALIVGAVFFVIVYLNVEVARGLAPDYPRVSADGDLIEPGDERLKKLVRWAGLAVAAVVAVVAGYSVSADWLVYALALRAGEWGANDPQFGRDLAFYVFSLPALQAALSLLIAAVVAALIAAGIAHLVLGGIEYNVDTGRARPADGPAGPVAVPQRPNVDVKLGGRAIAHLSALFAAVFALVGVGQLFRAWDLLFSPGGVVFGATWTDVNVRLPVARVTLVLAFALAVFLVVNVWRRRQWWPVIALVVWVVALVVLRGVVPAVVQQICRQPQRARPGAAVHHAQPRRHARGLQPRHHRAEGLPGGAPSRRPGPGRRPRHPAQHPPVGPGDPAAQLHAAPAAAALLRLPQRRHRPLHGRRRLPPDDAGRARARISRVCRRRRAPG